MNFDELKNLSQWALCFAEVGEKQPVVVTKKWIDKVLKVYPHYFDEGNDDFITVNDNLWLNYTVTINDVGEKCYTGDLVNTGATINFKNAWLSYNIVDKLNRNSLMLFPVNREKHLCFGFIFTKDCPWTIIDFDRKDGTTPQEIAYQDQWIQKFKSYTERSISGLGYHVIIEGKINEKKYPNSKGTGASGIRTGTAHKAQGIVGFELYSQDRFAVVTEDAVTTKEIYPRQGELDDLCAVLKKPTTENQDVTDSATEFKFDNSDDFSSEINFYMCELIMSPDWEVLSELFDNHCNYSYENDASKSVYNEEYTLTFPSQSEADFKLMAIISRYCPNNTVVKALFASSELARRPKATRVDYLNRMLERVREEQANEDYITEEPLSNTFVTVSETGEQTYATVDEIVERIEERKVKEKEAERKALINEFINKEYLNVNAETVLVNSRWKNEETDPSYSIANMFCDVLYATDVVNQLKRAGVAPSSDFVLFNSDQDISYKRLLDKGYLCTKGFVISDKNALIIPPTSSALMYELVKWSYETRIKPILEVSLTSVIAIISGIVGKMWQLPTGTGLNNYVILSARSGIGKEGLHTTKNDLFMQLRKRYSDTDFRRHVIDDDFASGQALVKRCLQEAGSKAGEKNNNPFALTLEKYASFVNFQKEFGKNLSEMGEDSRNQSAQSLKAQYLRLYTGSAENDMLSAMTYSNSDNNFTETYAPAFSIVGEATISGIADSLTPQMAKDGFLSRFLTVTYKGGAVPQNKDKYGSPAPTYVLDKLNELLEQEKVLSGHADTVKARFIRIKMNDDAEEFNLMLENWCMEMLDQAGDAEHFRQAWNRCQLKILKLAGICAVCQNYSDPVINIQHISWATRLVFLDIANIYDMITNGETSLTDNAENTMANSLLDAIKKFILTSNSVVLCNATNIPVKIINQMRGDRVVPISYINYALGSQKVFVRAKTGYTRAIQNTIDRLINEGAIELVPKPLASTTYKTKGVCYRLLDLRGIQ